MKWVHVHLIGGPMCGETMEIQGVEHDDDEYELPEAFIIPTSDSTGEMYLLASEEAACGYPSYLYAGYDWEPGTIMGNLEDEE